MKLVFLVLLKKKRLVFFVLLKENETGVLCTFVGKCKLLFLYFLRKMRPIFLKENVHETDNLSISKGNKTDYFQTFDQSFKSSSYKNLSYDRCDIISFKLWDLFLSYMTWKLKPEKKSSHVDQQSKLFPVTQW